MSADHQGGVLRWTPEPEDGGGIYRARFVGTSDNSSEKATEIRVAAPAATLVSNPSFENGWTGWKPSPGVLLALAPRARSGSAALAAQGPDTTAEFGISDDPNWVRVSGPAHGTRYRFACWVHADSAYGTAQIVIGENLKRMRVATSRSAPVIAGAGWRKVVVDHVTAAGGSALEFAIVFRPNRPGARFEVDDVSARRVEGPAAHSLMTGQSGTGVDHPGPVLSPNPLRERGALTFTLEHRGRLEVAIYDVSGRRVRTLFDSRDAEPGAYRFELDRRDDHGARLAPGVFFYRLATGDATRHGRFVILE